MQSGFQLHVSRIRSGIGAATALFSHSNAGALSLTWQRGRRPHRQAIRMSAAQPPTIGAIFLVFFRIGLLSFGGGLTGWVYREVVVLRPWLAEDEFMSGLAMCQILPGGNVSNFSIYIGQKLRGPLGSFAALFGLIVGPFFFVIAIASAYYLLTRYSYVQPAMDGIAASAIGLTLLVSFRGVATSARHPAALIALVATFAGVALFNWSLPLVAAVVGVLSVAAAWMRQRQAHEG
jgi:chromate transporter